MQACSDYRTDALAKHANARNPPWSAALAMSLAMSLAAMFTSCATITTAHVTPANVDVNWTDPGAFSDRRDSFTAPAASVRREASLKNLSDHLSRRAERVIGADEHLAVTFTDIDRAGAYQPWRGPAFDDIRFVTDVYPPRIDLRFTLTDASGAPIASGERALRDPGFLNRATVNPDDPLRYEKRLLDDWLRREFPEHRASRS